MNEVDMSMSKKISEHEIVTVESDRDRVRLRPAIYTTSTDKYGAIHIICNEIVDNSLDELTSRGSKGDTITLTFDEKTKFFSVVDNGGGIPHDGMLKAVSVLSSSGKYANDENSHFGQSVGYNGYGAKLLTFLSSSADFTSHQNGKFLTYIFEDGLLKETKTGKSKDHGTSVSGILSQQFVDVKNVTADDLESRYREKAFLYPDINMNFVVLNNCKIKKSVCYQGKDIAVRVAEWKPDTPVIRATGSKSVQVLENLDDDKLVDRKVNVDVAFAFTEKALDEDSDHFIIAYGNGAYNENGGTHVVGLKEGVVKWYKQCMVPNLKGKDKELQILPSDITAALCAFVTVRVYQPQFHAQVKNRLDNPEAKYAVRDVVFETLKDIKTSTANAISEIIKRVAKGRMASKKTRKKDVGNVFSKDYLDKYVDIVYNMDTVSPELLLCEGR